MNNIAIINMMDISKYSEEEINGKTSLEMVLNYANQLPEIKEIIFFSKTDILKQKAVIHSNWTEEILIKEMFNVSRERDNIFYFYADTPLLDKTLTMDMYKDHINFYAEYTFADGFPYGLTPEILDSKILPALVTLSKNCDTSVKRDSIFEIVKRDINSFELETIIAKHDLRLLRVSLTVDSKRNTNLIKRVVDLGGVDHESITDILQNRSEILFQEPAYVTIEINKEQSQNVSYLPERRTIEKYMSLDRLDTILYKIKEYSDDFTVSFVPEYEPLKHPDIEKIIELITVKYGLLLYLEVSGLLWNEVLFETYKKNKNLNVIVTVDALDRELYKSLRGNGYAEVYATAKKLIELKKERVWIQATRMKDNESDMEPFYRYWQEYTDQIIIQKYSDYNKRLDNRKVADLSPLKRFPCWHLKRDLHITTEGNVTLCFNDINGDNLLGSLVDDDINDIMTKKKAHYQKHIDVEYCDMCRDCDEYYTFNF